MRSIPGNLQGKLASGETTLCNCWRINPKFGPALGFTDHDCDLVFGDLTYEASSGFEASGVERELGLSIDNAAAKGALQSERITEADIRRGRFDGAEVEQWLVDWSAPDDRLLTFRGEIGDISRSGSFFEAELRGLAERLNRPVGRRYLHICDAVLGDQKCGVDLTSPTFRAETTVLEPRSSRSFLCAAAGDAAASGFSGGSLIWRTGDAEGQTVMVRSVTDVDGDLLVEVDRDLVGGPAPGDELTLFAGCDKRKATCAQKFNNLSNFRGFPHMPGEAWVTAYPVEGDVHDGGSQSGG